jgi:hypothetical protein
MVKVRVRRAHRVTGIKLPDFLAQTTELPRSCPDPENGRPEPSRACVRWRLFAKPAGEARVRRTIDIRRIRGEFQATQSIPLIVEPVVFSLLFYDVISIFEGGDQQTATPNSPVNSNRNSRGTP